MKFMEAIQARFDRYKEAKRRLDRSKLLFDDTRISLLGDFYEKAVGPLIASGITPGQFCDRYQERQRNLMKVWITGWSMEIFPVPVKIVPEQCPQYSYKALFGEDADVICKFVEKYGYYTGTRTKALDIHNDWLRREGLYYPAVFQRDALESLTWPEEKTRDSVEFMCLVFDEGLPLADFWDAVNNMKDYSAYFPDRPVLPKGKNNSRKEKPQLSPKGEWVWAPSAV